MSRARNAVAVLAAVSALSSVGPASAGAYPGENGKIVYVAGDDVFTVNPDGTSAANVTNTPGLDAENVAASPDGKRIAFNVGTQSVLDDAGLYVVNMDGSGVRDVLARRHDDFIAIAAPTWSPDGKRLAFEGFDSRGYRNDLFVIDADGADLERLTDCGCVGSSYPVWSPVAPEIAFVPCCRGVITTIDVDTKTAVDVYAPEATDTRNLTWSPDGTQIAFDDLLEVYRVSIPDGTPVPLTSTGPGGYYSNPSWSPDGTKILVESNHASQQSDNRDIYTIDAAQGLAGGVTRVTTALDAEGQPEWAPLCEAQCMPTVLGFRVAKTNRAVKISGRIRPAVRGRATVTLSRKTPSGFKKVGSKRPAFGTEGHFRTSFRRPAKGKCRVQVRYAGDTEREPSRAVRFFAC